MQSSIGIAIVFLASIFWYRIWHQNHRTPLRYVSTNKFRMFPGDSKLKNYKTSRTHGYLAFALTMTIGSSYAFQACLAQKAPGHTPFNLDLTSKSAILSPGHLVDKGPITITVGSQQIVVDPSSNLTQRWLEMELLIPPDRS